jgi:hypothetical protein
MVGYKVHLTETCDEKTPHLIVNVETTPATTPDDNMLDTVHDSLKRRELLPAEHLVDKGYTDARALVHAPSQYGVAVVGPVAEDPSWQPVRVASTRKVSSWIGIAAWRRVLSASRVFPGSPIPIRRMAWLSRRALRGRIARRVSKPHSLYQIKAGAAHRRVAGAGVS